MKYSSIKSRIEAFGVNDYIQKISDNSVRNLLDKAVAVAQGYSPDDTGKQEYITRFWKLDERLRGLTNIQDQIYTAVRQNGVSDSDKEQITDALTQLDHVVSSNRTIIKHAEKENPSLYSQRVLENHGKYQKQKDELVELVKSYEVLQPSEVISPEGKLVVLPSQKPVQTGSNRVLSYVKSIGQSTWKKAVIATAAAGVLITTGLYALIGTTGCATSDGTNRGEFVIKDPYHPAAHLTETRPSFKISADFDMDPRANIIVINGIPYSPVELKKKDDAQTKKDAPQTEKPTNNLENVVNANTANTNAPIAAEKPKDYKLEKPKYVQQKNPSNTNYQAKAPKVSASGVKKAQPAKAYTAAQPTNAVPKKVAAKQKNVDNLDKILKQELKEAKIEATKPQPIVPKSKGYDANKTTVDSGNDYEGMRFNIGGRFSDNENLGKASLFIPLVGGNSDLLFGELGGFIGNEPGFNAGLGYRHNFDDSLILGLNGFGSSTHLGGGAELFSKWIDLNANFYSALKDAELIEASETSTQIINKYRIPMTGFEGDIGFLVPLIDKVDTRLRVGYTDLKGDYGDEIKGVKFGIGVATENGWEIDAFAMPDKDNSSYGLQVSIPLGKAPKRSGIGSRIFAPVRRDLSNLVKEQDFYYPRTGGASEEYSSGGSNEPEPTPEPTPEPEPGHQPQPSENQHLNNNNDATDPVNTGSDPNTGSGSTPSDPVPSPDPDPHTF